MPVNLSLAILVLFFEKAEQTVECLTGFDGTEAPIYILDNGSSANSRKILDQYIRSRKNIIIIDEAKNVGVGPGRNRLIDASSEEWLFFVDNDIVCSTPDWSERLAFYIAKHPEIEVFVPRLFNFFEQQWQIYSDFEIVNHSLRRKPLTSVEINNFPGGAAIVKRSVFERVGNYDENIFVGGEDYELSLRCMVGGRPIKGMLVDDISLVHKHLKAHDAATRAAAFTRYDLQRVSESMKYIEEKHGVVVRSGWEEWVPRKLELMTRGEFFWERWIRQLKVLKRKVF